MGDSPRLPTQSHYAGMRQYTYAPRTDAALAHDLTNYLTAISGLAQVGRLIESPEAKDAYMVRIEAAVQDLAGMLRTMLAARPQDPRQLTTGHDLALLVEQLLAYQEPRFKAKGVALRWERREPLPSCRVAQMSFKQAVAHLVDNALRESPRGGTVTVRMSRCNRPPGLLIRVQDTGVGIPKHLVSQVCQPGYTMQADGWGLGLPVAREIIELMHGGRLSLRSREGFGTTANAFLPA